MIELVTGEKGSGKTKMLMAKASNDSKVTGIHILYLDINSKHIDELDDLVRLINISEYNIRTTDMFLGFLYGIISQNPNIDRIFMDNFSSIAGAEDSESAENVIRQISDISDQFEIDFVIGLSQSRETLSPYLSEMVSISL